ncbi:MAG TPA: hypothetical protein ENJ56_00840, partial [Anaerolineae bacterium]|nr:hypothetical protein [Anaerolineae bacterium]
MAHLPPQNATELSASTMNTVAYLQRLNYTDSLTPSSQTLRALQLSHLFNIPFENLSIHNNEP